MSYNKLEQFEELYKAFDQGLYTENEVVSKSLELLGEGNTALWAIFPPEIKEQIRKQLNSLSDDDELVSFGHENVVSLKRRLIVVKQWLVNLERTGL